MSGLSIERSSVPDIGPSGLDLRRLFSEAVRESRRIAVVTLTATLVTLGIAFLLPRWYRATAVILPPEQTDLFSNVSMAQRALSKFPAFGVLPDFFTPADIFKAILESRTTQEEVIRTLDLQRVYRQKSAEKTIRELKNHYKVTLRNNGTIRIDAEDRDPRRAAAMANTFLVALDRYNIENRNTQARRTRLFLERRVGETDSLLRDSEVRLKEYQEAHHAVAATSVGSADVSASANVMARKLVLEVRLGLLRSYLLENNEQVIQARNELDQLNQRIASLPALQTDLQRLVRNNKVQEQLYLLLTAELEQARIRETMDTPTVQILDPARPPERHSRPRRILLALGAGALAFLGSMVWIAVRQAGAVVPEG
ncbi:MAG TPA: Wzz/FepE/Etk N-terminal domain-containing protein [Candidatus Eisenbacteria bacterium]